MFNVVLASSNEYCPFLLITLTSLLENNKDDFECINIFIFDNGIDNNNKSKILILSEKYPCKITLIKLTIFDSLDIELPKMNLKHEWSLTTYSRLFVSSILPTNIDKILFLDCDAIVLGSFKELWDMDLENYYCAAVLDPFNGFQFKNDFWYLNVENYINAGVLLINLEKWRTMNVEDKFIKFLEDHQGCFFFVDQGVINIVLEDKIKIIEPKYNLISYFQFLDYDLAKAFSSIGNEYYTKEIVDESRNNPVFVHFAGGGYKLPWINKDYKFSSIFKKYAEMANCEEIIQYQDAPTFLAKLLYSNNKLLISILKLIPSKIILKFKINKSIEYLKSEQLKLDELKE